MEAIKAIRGTHDVLPAESYKWQYLENVILDSSSQFGFSEIRLPTFEASELFYRSVGDTTDVVQKEMYTFDDKGGRSITLRPEGTAGTVRALIENSLYGAGLPIKLMYNTLSCFRYEKPQAGRLREFHQFGVEVFGSEKAAADAEVIALPYVIFQKLGLKKVELHLNSIGCKTCRAAYHKALKAYFEAQKDALCATCLDRLEKNPMRILDCKSRECQKIAAGAPLILDYICGDCKDHFEEVQQRLSDIGISFSIDPRIVRGLDYYNRTVFEYVAGDIGAQNTVCGGGRYDGLVESMGGPALPGLGFGMGMERLLLTLESEKITIPEQRRLDLFLATIGEPAARKAAQLAFELRQNGIAVQYDVLSRSLKAQMKYADKQGARFSMVLGDNEIESGKAAIKDMETGEKEDVCFPSLAAFFLK